MKKLILITAVLLCVSSHDADAAPYRPASPDEVIERIPEVFRGDEGKKFASLRASVETNPEDRAAAIRFAKICIERGRTLSDPRFFGYAEAVVREQIRRSPGDPELLVLRAILAQRRHDFEDAERDLAEVLEKQPGNAQAWLTLASVQIVRGEFEPARSSCRHLLPLASPLTAVACMSLVGSLTGSAEQSYRALEAQLQNAESQHADTEGEGSWATSILGEIAERLGRPADAERWYRRGLAQSPQDAFLLAALADLLLSSNRAEEVVTLLAGKENADPLLLRLAIAEKRSKREEFSGHRELLRRRFEEEEQRGEAIHARERAMFELEIQENAAAAVAFAKKDWARQKESADLFILWRAGVAAHDAEALELVRSFRAGTQLEDARIAASEVKR